MTLLLPGAVFVYITLNEHISCTLQSCNCYNGVSYSSNYSPLSNTYRCVLFDLLQKHKPEELRAAEQRIIFPYGEDVLDEFGPFISQCGGPSVLLFGSSHVLHLKSFLRQPKIEDKYLNTTKNFAFVGVGGSTFEMIEKHIHGEELSQYQAYLGSQWPEYKASPHVPTFTAILLGCNEVDQFDRDIKAKSRKYRNMRKLHWLEAKMELNAAFQRIKGHIDSVLSFLLRELPGTTLLYMKILPRFWWSNHARKLARWIDFYILVRVRQRRHIHIREIWLREVFATHYHFEEQVMPGMIKTDCVHLNPNGNRALIYGMSRPLLHMWRARCRQNYSCSYYGKSPKL